MLVYYYYYCSYSDRPALALQERSTALAGSPKAAEADELLLQLVACACRTSIDAKAQAADTPPAGDVYERTVQALTERAAALAGTQQGRNAKEVLAAVLVDQVRALQEANGDAPSSRADIVGAARAPGGDAAAAPAAAAAPDAAAITPAVEEEAPDAAAAAAAAVAAVADGPLPDDDDWTQSDNDDADADAPQTRGRANTAASMAMRAADPKALVGKAIDVDGRPGIVIALAKVKKGSSTLHTINFDDGKTETIQLAKKPGAKGATFHVAEE